MKKFWTLSLIIVMAFNVNAQETNYLLFEFMGVKSGQWDEYNQVEEFWSGIHKQRVADKSIIGWDLWALTPNGAEQGSQYLTVTVFANLKDMLTAVHSLDVMAYIKKAYPNKSQKELTEMYDKTDVSRDLNLQLVLKGVVHTKDNFQMKVGTMAFFSFTKELDESYEKVVSDVFLPLQQKLVDEGKKGSYELLEVLLPVGKETYADYLSVSMYNDISQIAEAMERATPERDMITTIGLKEASKTRHMKEAKMARLQMMVR